jgi:hypothetical protein
MSTVSLCGRVLITATFSTATRSDEVNARPSSSSYPAITGVASVSVCAARFDQVRINAAGTPAISACPSLLTGVQETPRVRVSSLRSAAW